jgi:hypothetical protein
MAPIMSGAIIGLIGAQTKPALAHAELEQDALDRVLAEQHDDVAAFQPAREEPVSDLVGQLVGLPVGQPAKQRVGAGPLGGDQRLLVGEAPGDPLEQVTHAGALPAVNRPPVVQAGHVEDGFHGGQPLCRCTDTDPEVLR